MLFCYNPTMHLRHLAWTLLLVAAPAAAQPVPPQTVVIAADPDAANTGPAVGADGFGNLVVAWSHRSCDGGVCRSTVHARRLDASGQPLDDAFQVSPNPIVSTPFAPVLAVSPPGTFLIAWPGDSLSGRGQQIRGRCFDASGNPFGLRRELGISSVPAVAADSPAVAPLAAGAFVVVWRQVLAGSGSRIFARRYDAACAPLGPVIAVDPQNRGFNPSVAGDISGGFLVVWEGVSPRGNDLVGQLYGQDGNPVGGKIALPERRRNRTETPVAAADPRGGFAVAWRNAATGAVRLRRFDEAVEPLGPEVRVDMASDAVGAPRLAFDPEGGLLVAWLSGQTALGCCTGRWFDRSGQPRGRVFAVAPPEGGNGRVQVTATEVREIFAVWENAPNNVGESSRILGRKLLMPPRR